MGNVIRRVGLVLLAAIGASGGMLLAGRAHADIGPFEATLALHPSLTGDTMVRLAPLGTLTLDAHDGLVGLTATADEVDVVAARRVVEDPDALDEIDDDALRDARSALREVFVRGALGALAGATAVTALRRPRPRAVAASAVVAAVVIASAGAGAAVTRNPTALAQPRYTGLLSVAPQAIGSIERVQAQYSAYRSQLTALIGNVAQLYNTASDLQSFAPAGETIRVLHVSDLHLNPQSFDVIAQLVRQFKIDVVVDTGDINDWGTTFETRFVNRIADVDAPYVYVRGNHDSMATQEAIASQPNAVVLDGEAREVAGLRFWGIGDPRFTPDKTEEVGISEEREIADRYAPTVARRLRASPPVDVAVVHDPRTAADLAGITPLVLAGHLHKSFDRELGEGTRMLIEGSTGGAGLRTLEQGQPVALSCSVLYFDVDSRMLQAYDRVSVAGLGDTGVRIQRHVLGAG